MNNGIYFTKIASLGQNKTTAFIDFYNGVNVVSGASETGKSYLIDCIDFVLGSQDQPRDVTLAKEYQQIRAEMKTFEGKVITLNRQLGDNYIYVAECGFNDFESVQPQKLSIKHDEQTDNNISSFLLNILKLKGKKLKKNSRNEKQSLSFRDLARFCLVSETKIIDERSPIYSKIGYNDTVNESLFKLLLTGEDDDDLEKIENIHLVRSSIKGKIDLIKEDIQSKDKQLIELRKRLEKVTTEEVNVQIQKLITIVEEAHRGISEEEKKRALIFSELDKITTAVSQNEEIMKRFKLLDQHYTSDLNRLEFINEGKQGLDQLKEVNCPLCDSLIAQKILEPYMDEEGKFLNSVRNEFSKIKKKKEELLETIEELKNKAVELESKEKTIRENYAAIDKYISDKLMPVHKLHDTNLRNFLALRDEKTQAQLIEDQVIELKKSLEYYGEKLKEKQKIATEKIIPEKVYSELSDVIKEVLLSWGVDCEKLYYNPTTYDIEINGEKRSNSGKGYRALYLSAFMIGVMLFCYRKGLKHPYFLVLDSPLTTFKDRDGESRNESDVVLSEKTRDKFYASLIKIPGIDKMQIIVIENKDPPKELQSKMNYVHFSKNTNIGRYGFYPM